MDIPTWKNTKKQFWRIPAAGVKVNITEMEISALPSPWGTSANVSDKVEYEEK
jgi:endo-1,4-beta-xylanase